MLTENEHDILRFLDEADQNGEIVEYLRGFGSAHLKISGGQQGPHCSPRELVKLEQNGYIQRTPPGNPMYMRITSHGKAQI